MNLKHGGAAFPSMYQLDEGMSLRDYFAGQALALGGEFFHLISADGATSVIENAVIIAYQVADAMIAERVK